MKSRNLQRTIFILVTALSTLSAAEQPAGDTTFHAALDKASSCFEQSDFQGALAVLQTVDQGNLSDFDRATLLNRIGSVYFRLGDFRLAQTTLTDAVGLWDRTAPRSVDRAIALTSLSSADHRLGEYSKAEKTARVALAALEETGAPPAVQTSALQNLAAIDVAEGRAAEAEALYRRAIHVSDPPTPLVLNSLATAHNNLGRLVAESGRFEEGLQEARLAVDLWARAGDRSREIYGWSNFAVICLKAGRYRDAEEPIRRARSMALEIYGPDNPVFEQIHEVYGTLLTKTGRGREGRAMLADAYRIHRLTARNNQMGNTVDVTALMPVR